MSDVPRVVKLKRAMYDDEAREPRRFGEVTNWTYHRRAGEPPFTAAEVEALQAEASIFGGSFCVVDLPPDAAS